MMNEIWIATSNNGKVQEYSRLFEKYRITVHSARELSAFTFPPENGKTFAENARIKAKALAAVKNTDWVLGEDSGLEVLAMDGLPGIHSARYAGNKASDSENYTKLLKMMQIRRIADRNARFRCSICVFSPNAEEYHFDGILNGRISDKISGQAGFGYDPVFVPEGENQTLADLGLAVKNRVSHRAHAVRQLAEKLGLK